MRFGSFGRDKGKRNRDRGDEKAAAGAKPPERLPGEPVGEGGEPEPEAPAAAAPPDAADTTPAEGSALELLQDGPEEKKGRFSWLKGFSTRQKVIIALCVAAVLLIVFGPRKPRRAATTEADGGGTGAAPAAHQQQSGTPPVPTGRGSTRGTDDLDPGATNSPNRPYPSRVLTHTPGNASSTPTYSRPAETAGQPGAYERQDISVIRPSATGTSNSSSVATAEPASGSLASVAGAPRGVTVPPATGKAAVLPEILRMESDGRRIAPPSGIEQRQSTQPASTAESMTGAEARAMEPTDFAPFGRLIKCRLVFTVDSVMTGAPIIAIVTEDLSWNGVLIVPANTELFSKAQTVRRDVGTVGRVIDSGDWVMVLPEYYGRTNGRELKIKAHALDRRELLTDEHGKPISWGLDDGGLGLQGDSIATTDRQEIQMFAAKGLAGLAKGVAEILQDREPASGMLGAFGAMQSKPTVKNAVTEGLGTATKDIMDTYVQRIVDDIQANGSYVRVAGGKEFYLFVEQTLQPAQARVGVMAP